MDVTYLTYKLSSVWNKKMKSCESKCMMDLLAPFGNSNLATDPHIMK